MKVGQKQPWLLLYAVRVQTAYSDGDFGIFPVGQPCTGLWPRLRPLRSSLVELDFVDFVFTVGCTTAVHECVGFEPPMNKVAKVRGPRALPLKATLFDELGAIITDTDIASWPVIEVLFTSAGSGTAVDVTDDALPVGQSTSGNSFAWDPDADRWKYNLSTQNYSASGTYTISMKTGDAGEYAVDPTCVATFVVD